MDLESFLMPLETVPTVSRHEKGEEMGMASVFPAHRKGPQACGKGRTQPFPIVCHELLSPQAANEALPTDIFSSGAS